MTEAQRHSAVAIGLNEAIFIQQVHYWLKASKHEHDGRAWVYNTLDGWREQFPFWGLSTIRRTIDSLRKSGILLTGNYNQTTSDRTLWYSIDYDVLNNAQPSVDSDMPSVQDEQMEVSKMNTPSVQNEQMLIGTETTTETTQRRRAGATQANTRPTENPEYRQTGKQPSIVGAMIDRGVLRGQALGILKSNPDLSIEHLEAWDTYLENNPKKGVGFMIDFFRNNVLMPPGHKPKKLTPDGREPGCDHQGNFSITQYNIDVPLDTTLFHRSH